MQPRQLALGGDAPEFDPGSADPASLDRIELIPEVHLVRHAAEQAVLGRPNRVYCCAFSPDGSLLATTSQDGTAQLRRMPAGARHAVLVGHTGRVTGCAFSPDCTLVATTGTDHTARLWQVTGGAAPAVLTGHTCPAGG